VRILGQAPPTWVVLPKTERAGELQPDVILVDSTPQTAALQRETRTIPIVFVVVSDRVGSGFVASLSRPGGNITGFSNQDSTMGGKCVTARMLKLQICLSWWRIWVRSAEFDRRIFLQAFRKFSDDLRNRRDDP